jgi:hypothetical protein
VKENPNSMAYGSFQYLVANGRFQCLVALEKFQAWWPLKGKGKTSLSSLLIFPPTNFT